jgi:hypothetical protein
MRSLWLEAGIPICGMKKQAFFERQKCIAEIEQKTNFAHTTKYSYNINFDMVKQSSDCSNNN